MSSDDDVRNLYVYSPNKALPIVGAVLFGLATVVTIGRTYKLTGWRYMWAWVLGGILETIGYGARRASINNPTTDGGIGIYALSTIVILVAPALLAATLYMIYGRMVLQVDNGKRSIVRPSRVTLIFVLFDIISFLVQAYGGGMYASKNIDTVKKAKSVLLIGLIIQIVAFGIFLIISVLYKVRVNKYENGLGRHSKLLWLLWGVGILILIRSIFRTIEFGSGSEKGNSQTGYILTHEVFFYVLEALPMLLCILAVTIFHPSSWLVGQTETEEDAEKRSNSSYVNYL